MTRCQRRRGGIARRDCVALVLQIDGDKIGDLLLIIHDQDLFCHKARPLFITV